MPKKIAPARRGRKLNDTEIAIKRAEASGDPKAAEAREFYEANKLVFASVTRGGLVDPDLHRQRKKESDHDRGKFRNEKRRAARARVPRHPDPERKGGTGLVSIPFAGPDPVPMAQTPAGQYEVPDEFHAARVREIQQFLASHAAPNDAGQVMRADLQKVREAYVLFFGEANAAILERRWQFRLRGAFAIALRSRLGDPRVTDGSVEGATIGTGGATILHWLKKKCGTDSVPTKLTAKLIDGALDVATLNLRGGGQTKKRNWEIVVAELIATVDSQTQPRK